MRIVLNLDETPPTIEQSATASFKRELTTDIEIDSVLMDSIDR